MKRISMLAISMLVLGLLLTMNSCQMNPDCPTDVTNSSTVLQMPDAGNASGDFTDKDKMDVVLSDEMQVNPYRIIINSKSNTNFVKTIFSGSIPSGYHISDFDIEIYIEDVMITDAIEFDFCYIDQMFSVTYSKSEIVNNDFVRSLSGSTVDVVSQGSYTLMNNDNQTIVVNFAKYGTAIILGS